MCDGCFENKISIASIQNNNLKCYHFCELCVEMQLEQQLSQPEIQIKMGNGDENNGKFIAFFQGNQKLRQTAFDILINTAEMKARCQKEFKFCPTCNKIAIYVEKQSLLYFCQQCNNYWCTDCGEWHTEEFQCVVGDTKRCPNRYCRTFTIKDSGCNHITCSLCKAHWCYVCGKQFAADTIYPHLSAVHGGINTQ
ncbi:Conserved_hypothetical protein [Hexamita inflata]|uniref:RING-type domain-containing protein n=1 Tax=Hexamita inflata TaxID=28002 RepID=A0AA86UKW6_9EUKA|nr:Conserved hypothetical protein [Hexamita inflata]